MRSVPRTVLSLGVICLAISPVHADLLNLVPTNPDLSAGLVLGSYNAGSDTFTINGTPLMYDLGGVNHVIAAPRSFNITATVNGAGVATGGSLTVTGTSGGDGPSLLTGTLTDFGFNPAGGSVFEFIFDLTGGDLAPIFGGVTNGILGAIVRLPGVNFNGTFTGNFANTAFGTADIFPIPAPSSVLLGLFGAIALCVRRGGRAALSAAAC